MKRQFSEFYRAFSENNAFLFFLEEIFHNFFLFVFVFFVLFIIFCLSFSYRIVQSMQLRSRRTSKRSAPQLLKAKCFFINLAPMKTNADLTDGILIFVNSAKHFTNIENKQTRFYFWTIYRLTIQSKIKFQLITFFRFRFWLKKLNQKKFFYFSFGVLIFLLKNFDA